MADNKKYSIIISVIIVIAVILVYSFVPVLIHSYLLLYYLLPAVVVTLVSGRKRALLVLLILSVYHVLFFWFYSEDMADMYHHQDVINIIIALLLVMLFSALRDRYAKQVEMANLALEQSNNKFMTLFYENHAIILIIDPATGKIIDANAAAVTYYGYPEEILRSMKIYEINCTAQDSVSHEMHSAAGHTKNHFYFNHKLANGETREVEVFSYPLFLNDKKVLYSVITDITELNNLQKKLINSEKQKDLILNSMRGVLIEFIDKNMHLVYMNKALQDEFQLDPLHDSNFYCYRFIRGLDSPCPDCSAVRAFATGNVEEGVIKIPSGKSLLVRSTPVKDNRGEVVNVLHVALDITEQVKITERLRESEERYKRLVENSPFIVYSFSRQYGGIYYSKYVEKVLGYKVDDFYKNPFLWDSLIVDEDRETVATAIEELGKGVYYEIQYRMVNKEGGIVWLFDRSIRRQRSENDLVIESIAMDITQQKKYETDIINARNEAEHANMAKNDFLANMSHELRTPLNGIIGFTSLLLEDENADKYKRDIYQLIDRSSKSLYNIISELLDYSKIEAGIVSLTANKFHLYSLVSNVQRIYGKLADEKGINFALNYDEGIPEEFIGDVGKLQKIMYNIVSNAVKFTEEGSITISIKNQESNQTENKVFIEFIVTDTGVGFDINKGEEIFEPFSIHENYVTKKHAGVGLGLTIAKRYIDSLMGFINIKSEIGKGSEIRFVIPFEYVHNMPPEKSLDKKVKILAAEDNDINQRLLKHIMADHGWLIDVAENGTEVIKKLTEEIYDIVLMDIQMPEMNGLETTEYIRKMDNNEVRNIPIIAVSSYAYEEDKTLALSIGVNDYITKPYDKNVLVAMIEKYVADYRAHHVL